MLLLRRVGQVLFVIWLAFTLSFILLNVLPGDAVLAKLGGVDANRQITEAELAAIRAQVGLDGPLVTQYLQRLGGVVTLNLGHSLQTREPVLDMLVTALPPTLQLAAAGFLLAIAFGGLLGATAAYTRTPWLRTALLAFGTIGTAVPAFWIGISLITLFSFWLPLFPASGTAGPSSLVLPAITLAIMPASLVTQVFYESLARAMSEPFATTAVMKGASRMRVLVRHGIRNAAVPVVTLAGVVAGYLLVGSVVVETVFSRAGIGYLTVNAVRTVDLSVISGLVVFSAVVFVTLNLLVDLACPFIDPRMRAGMTS
ncbi:ABC transporter permease [Pseudonocardia sp. NPDC049635]|uniref:ABC transporter permease n=1 Tax=Pseudonocardia sp. NPDC049635 TaxID=3155506 RepID=UPI0033CACD8C